MKRLFAWGAVLLIAITGISAAPRWLSILDRPGGSEVGRWGENAEVLLVDGDWAFVRVTGWVSAAEVAPHAPDMPDVQPLIGKDGLWVRDVRWETVGFMISEGRVYGWVVNTTDTDYEWVRFHLHIVNAEGEIQEIESGSVAHLPAGGERAFRALSRNPLDDDWTIDFVYFTSMESR